MIHLLVIPNCKCFVRSNEVLFVIYFLFRLTKRLASVAFPRLRKNNRNKHTVSLDWAQTTLRQRNLKTEIYSENASNGFPPHYFGGIYKRNNHRPFWTIRTLSVCRFFTHYDDQKDRKRLDFYQLFTLKFYILYFVLE